MESRTAAAWEEDSACAARDRKTQETVITPMDRRENPFIVAPFEKLRLAN
jgi:hypothetical protein